MEWGRVAGARQPDRTPGGQADGQSRSILRLYKDEITRRSKRPLD
jgi:hypothetical protein